MQRISSNAQKPERLQRFTASTRNDHMGGVGRWVDVVRLLINVTVWHSFRKLCEKVLRQLHVDNLLGFRNGRASLNAVSHRAEISSFAINLKQSLARFYGPQSAPYHTRVRNFLWPKPLHRAIGCFLWRSVTSRFVTPRFSSDSTGKRSSSECSRLRYFL